MTCFVPWLWSHVILKRKSKKKRSIILVSQAPHFEGHIKVTLSIEVKKLQEVEWIVLLHG